MGILLVQRAGDYCFCHGIQAKQFNLFKAVVFAKSIEQTIYSLDALHDLVCPLCSKDVVESPVLPDLPSHSHNEPKLILGSFAQIIVEFYRNYLVYTYLKSFGKFNCPKNIFAN